MNDNDWWPDAAAYLSIMAKDKEAEGNNAAAENLRKCANHIRSLRKEIETLSDRLQELESSKGSGL